MAKKDYFTLLSENGFITFVSKHTSSVSNVVRNSLFWIRFVAIDNTIVKNRVGIIVEFLDFLQGFES